MRILVLGINYAPELVGIGPYTTQLTTYLASRGHDVSVVTGQPYYPEWRRRPGFRRFLYRSNVEQGVKIRRCPLFVPKKPSGLKRILHHLSFALTSLPLMMFEALLSRPDLVISIAPSLLAAPGAVLAGQLARARTWLHVQDFEVAAAAATGLIDNDSLLMRLAVGFETFVMARFSHLSSISPQMCERLFSMTGSNKRVIELRNWTDTDEITPVDSPSPLREEWGIEAPNVALYSGNLANKQGIAIIAEAARRLRHRNDLLFLVCGDGSGKVQFVDMVKDLPNVRVLPLQPREKLQDLLSLATVHLLPQLKCTADLVLPSKLTNMLASGRPIIATADEGTGLANEVAGCGIVTAPGDGKAMARAIETLLESPELLRSYGVAARQRSEERWSKSAILDHANDEFERCVSSPRVLEQAPA